MILMGIIDEWDFWCPEFWHPPENNNCCNNLFGRQIFPNCIVLNDRFLWYLSWIYHWEKREGPACIVHYDITLGKKSVIVM